MEKKKIMGYDFLCKDHFFQQDIMPFSSVCAKGPSFVMC